MTQKRLHIEGEEQNVRQRKAGRGMRGLAALAALMLAVAIGLGVAYALNASVQMGSVSAQDDQALLEQEESKEPHVQNASTQVVDLISLIGLSRDAAIEQIGHGAALQKSDALGSMDFSNEAVLLLTDESGDSLSGTPTVRLGLSDDGMVEGASYEAPLGMLGYGQLAFADAVKRFHVVEALLSKAGLEVAEGSVALPDRSAYSSYESDRKTLASEIYTFEGTATKNGVNYAWQVTLDYDYSKANETSDLANTIKRASIGIKPA